MGEEVKNVYFFKIIIIFHFPWYYNVQKRILSYFPIFSPSLLFAKIKPSVQGHISSVLTLIGQSFLFLLSFLPCFSFLQNILPCHIIYVSVIGPSVGKLILVNIQMMHKYNNYTFLLVFLKPLYSYLFMHCSNMISMKHCLSCQKRMELLIGKGDNISNMLSGAKYVDSTTLKYLATMLLHFMIFTQMPGGLPGPCDGVMAQPLPS